MSQINVQDDKKLLKMLSFAYVIKVIDKQKYC